MGEYKDGVFNPEIKKGIIDKIIGNPIILSILILITVLIAAFENVLFSIDLIENPEDYTVIEPLATDSFFWIAIFIVFIFNIITNSDYKNINSTLKRLADRNVILNMDKFNSILEEFENFATDRKYELFSGILFSSLFLIAYFFATIRNWNVYPDYVWWMYPAASGSYFFIFWIFILFGIIWFFYVGIPFFKMFATVKYLKKIADNVDFEIHPFHPDKSGGLKPLGDLAFNLNKLTFGFGIVVTLFIIDGWDIVISDTFYFIIYSSLLASYILISLILFIFPIYNLHIKMAVHKKNLLQIINNKMQEMYRQVCTELKSNKSEFDEKKTKKMEELKKFYDHAHNTPVWPFNTNILVKLVSRLGVPVLIVLLNKVLLK